MNAHAIRIHEYGGPEVLQYESIEVPEPREGEATIRHTAIGLNFIDTYHRTGLYPLDLPLGLGTEAAGIIDNDSERSIPASSFALITFHIVLFSV